MFDLMQKLFPSRNAPRQDASYALGLNMVGYGLLIYGLVLLGLLASGSDAYPDMRRMDRWEMGGQIAVCLLAGVTCVLLAARARRPPKGPPSESSPRDRGGSAHQE